MALIGFDLGGTKLAGGRFDTTGRLIDRRESLLAGRTGGEVGELLRAMLHDLTHDEHRRSSDISGIGISVPGIAHPHSGRVWAPNIPGWEDYPLMDEVLAAIEPKGVRVVVDSDRACSILGEHWQGSARGCRHAVFLAVGTGIGAGILIDGSVLRGSQDIAGATGWMALDQPFRDEYIPCGCFEYHASGHGIAAVAKALISQHPTRSARLESVAPEALTAHDIFAAYDNHDPIAEEVVQGAIRTWGAAAANFVSLFNPERIIFGGGVFGPAVRFLDAIRLEASKWAQPISMRSVQFVPSALGPNAALIGAASLVAPDVDHWDPPHSEP